MYAVEYLTSRQVGFETLLHPPASVGSKRARSVHVPGRRVAKTVLVKWAESFALAVLPATSRIDLGLLAAALGTPSDPVRLATTDEIDRIFVDCEPGAIPPFGRLYGLTTVVDTALSEGEVIVLPSNTRHIDLRLPYRDYESVERPLRAAFGRPIAPLPPRPAEHPHRCAG